MSKQLKITVPEPCHEGWENMTPSEKGRFCGSCQKQVVDFTRMSDSQMIAFFKEKSNRSVCGHFEKDQLDRDMDIPRKRIPWVKYFFQFLIPAFLVTKAGAQSKPVVTIGTVQVDNDTDVRGKVFVPRVMATISGRVVDSEGKGVAGVRISVQLTTDTAITDSQGNFKLVYAGNTRRPMIFASGEGLNAVSKTIKLKKHQQYVNGVQFTVAHIPAPGFIEGKVAPIRK